MMACSVVCPEGSSNVSSSMPAGVWRHTVRPKAGWSMRCASPRMRTLLASIGPLVTNARRGCSPPMLSQRQSLVRRPMHSDLARPRRPSLWNWSSIILAIPSGNARACTSPHLRWGQGPRYPLGVFGDGSELEITHRIQGGSLGPKTRRSHGRIGV